MKEKRKYTMSPAAVNQRKRASKKEVTVGKMTVARISVRNANWSRAEYGSVNRALDFLYKNHGPKA